MLIHSVPLLVKLQSPTLTLLLLVVVVVVICTHVGLSDFFLKCRNTPIQRSLMQFNCFIGYISINVCLNAERSLCPSVMCVNSPVTQAYVILIIFSFQTQHCVFLNFLTQVLLPLM